MLKEIETKHSTGEFKVLGDIGERDPSEIEKFKELYEESLRDVEEGKVVSGIVVGIDDRYVTVDVGYKSDGKIPVSEFFSEEGISIKVEDRINVLIERREDEEGCVVLSKEKADRLRIWEELSEVEEGEAVVEGKIIGRVKGGLTVDIGVKAFLPGSQIDVRPVRDFGPYIGKTFRFKVLKFNKKRANIVLSRRVLIEEERGKLREELVTKLQEGQILEGTVKNITDYGAFVDLGGIDGLLHITDLSWSRINHPSEVVSVGQKIKVQVLKYDGEKNRVSLGFKQLQSDPWQDASQKYPIGGRIQGKVVNITDYGAFIEVAAGVEGLIHISEMSWTRRVKSPSQVLKMGDVVEAVVLDIDDANRRMSLGLKQLERNPWEVLEEKYPVGAVIEGEIKNVTDFGVFVGIEEGIDGLVHVSDLSWDHRAEHPGKLYKKGDKIRAAVLSIDPVNEKFSLGVKQLTENPWTTFSQDYHVGSSAEGTVINLTDFGAFVSLTQGVEGLIHISEMSDHRIGHPKEILKEGDKVQVEILQIDPENRRVGLRLKAVEESQEVEEGN
jgi:small subunit ribosomal protein S1